MEVINATVDTYWWHPRTARKIESFYVDKVTNLFYFCMSTERYCSIVQTIYAHILYEYDNDTMTTRTVMLKKTGNWNFYQYKRFHFYLVKFTDFLMIIILAPNDPSTSTYPELTIKIYSGK